MHVPPVVPWLRSCPLQKKIFLLQLNTQPRATWSIHRRPLLSPPKFVDHFSRRQKNSSKYPNYLRYSVDSCIQQLTVLSEAMAWNSHNWLEILKNHWNSCSLWWDRWRWCNSLKNSGKIKMKNWISSKIFEPTKNILPVMKTVGLKEHGSQRAVTIEPQNFQQTNHSVKSRLIRRAIHFHHVYHTIH